LGWQEHVLVRVPNGPEAVAWVAARYEAISDLTWFYIVVFTSLALYFRKPLSSLKPRAEAARRFVSELFAGHRLQAPLLSALASAALLVSWGNPGLAWAAELAAAGFFVWAAFPAMLAVVAVLMLVAAVIGVWLMPAVLGGSGRRAGRTDCIGCSRSRGRAGCRRCSRAAAVRGY
jgi:ABC-type dipeptide/oligopeptide/nickel transport system permease component